MPGIEVEAKYRLQGGIERWRRLLRELGAAECASVRQVDEYFAHPSRDFAQTGEAFRIRCMGDRNALTYKGPLLDSCTKTRTEQEIEFAPGAESAAGMREMLLALGFRPAGRVVKVRTPLKVVWEGHELSLALDDVAGLGAFLELELLAGDEDWQPARDVLLDFARRLGLGESERRSYLELLHAAGGEVGVAGMGE